MQSKLHQLRQTLLCLPRRCSPAGAKILSPSPRQTHSSFPGISWTNHPTKIIKFGSLSRSHVRYVRLGPFYRFRERGSEGTEKSAQAASTGGTGPVLKVSLAEPRAALFPAAELLVYVSVQLE